MTASAMPPLRAVRACPDPFRQSFPLESCFSGGLFPSRCSCALLQHTKQRRNTAFRRRTLDLFQSPTNSWREGLLEPAGTCSFEKTTFSRRRSRPPSRRWHFLEEGRALVRSPVSRKWDVSHFWDTFRNPRKTQTIENKRNLMCPVWQPPCLNRTVCVNTEHDMSCSNFKEKEVNDNGDNTKVDQSSAGFQQGAA